MVRVAGRGKDKQIAKKKQEYRNDVSYQARQRPEILDTEVRRVCRTSEVILGSVGFSAVTFRAYGW